MFISRPTFLFGGSNHSTLNLTINKNFTEYNMTILTNLYDLKSFRNENLNLYTIGIIIAIIDACSLGTSQVLIRKLCMKKVHYVISTIYTSYFGIRIN